MHQNGFKTTLGGRIFSNAGTDFKGTTLLNCFVGTKPNYDQDSLEGIFATLLAQAKTLKSEGGWGMNFSFIRPRGAFIHGIGVETPGAVKYMEIFDKSSDIITSGSGLKSKNKKAKGKIRKRGYDAEFYPYGIPILKNLLQQNYQKADYQNLIYLQTALINL